LLSWIDASFNPPAFQQAAILWKRVLLHSVLSHSMTSTVNQDQLRSTAAGQGYEKIGPMEDLGFWFLLA
jgi:hypothetical protein